MVGMCTSRKGKARMQHMLENASGAWEGCLHGQNIREITCIAASPLPVHVHLAGCYSCSVSAKGAIIWNMDA